MRSLAPAPDMRADFSDLIGVPFEWGGRGPDKFDCYGLVASALLRLGKVAPEYLSPTVHEQIARTITGACETPLWLPCEPGPGAVVTFRLGRHVAHVGLVLPHERFIHCWERSGGVCVERLEAWRQRISGYFRLPE